MNLQEIIQGYKDGILSTSQLRKALAEPARPSLPMPLSEGQKGLWMLQKMNPTSSAYNVPVCFRVSPRLDIEAFKAACRFAVRQYPVLASRIAEKDGEPYQISKQDQTPFFQVGDLTCLSFGEAVSVLRERSKVPFSLIGDPLMRVDVYALDAESHAVLITVHHIVFDGSSLAPFVQTLMDAYRERVEGREPAVRELPADFGEYVEREREMLQGPAGSLHLEYWKAQLARPLPVLDLPADRSRTGDHGVAGRTHAARIPKDLSDRISAFALECRTNRSIVFLAIFQVLLHRFSGQSDIVVGMPTLGRPEERFDALVGYFINMIAIRCKTVGEMSFADLLEEGKRTVVDGLDHAEYPFPRLVRELNVPRTPHRAPVFQVTFAYQNFMRSGSEERFRSRYRDRFDLEFVPGIRQEGEYELELEVFEETDGFRLHFKYDPALFGDATIERMARGYLRLTEAVLADPSLKPGQYPVLSREDETTLLRDWNATRTDYPRDLCVHKLFERQVLDTPDRIAVTEGDRAVTYAELNAKANQRAHFLQHRGVKPGSLVGILLPRSLDRIVALLAILKAGAAYVPIEPDSPPERIAALLDDCGASFVLSCQPDCVSVPPSRTVTIDLEDPANDPAAFRPGNLETEIGADDLAYVTYTSGTTGKPKGVEIRHRGITRLVCQRQFHFLNPNNTVLQYAPLSFDASTFEIWGALCTGAQLAVCPAGRIGLDELGRVIRDQDVTVLWLTSALFGQMVENRLSSLAGVRYLLAGGDVLLPGHVKQALENIEGVTLINGYGPTENTTFTTLYAMNRATAVGDSIPIGRPLDNTQVYILNQHLQPVPVGVKGELYTGGDGLARGYRNNPDLTREKLIDNPFSDEPGSKLYKTGDLVSYRPDGNIIFLGRVDDQVKIRGFRIEPAEIENRLSTHPEVEDCAVVVKTKDHLKCLVAFYVPKPGARGAREPVDRRALKNWLRTHLPDSMIPAFFVPVNQLPVTPNGKVDRRSLSEREGIFESGSQERTPPNTGVEAQLAAIWQDVLGGNHFGPDDGFFDVGGDSLLAMVVADRIKRKIHDGFTVTDLFKYPNLRELGAFIAQQNGNAAGGKAARSSSPPPSPVVPTNGKEKGGLETPTPTVPKSQGLRRSKAYPDYYQQSLAVIGISCRFPGASDTGEFWRNLREGRESVRFYSHDELLQAGVPLSVIRDPRFVPLNSALDRKDRFDADFFNVSFKDAERMDPQLRLLLMHAWSAFEDAGYSPRQVPSTAVFMSAGGYAQPISISNSPERTNVIGSADEYVALILAQNGTIPTMISHKLGLKGPSFFIHSNCSSSLAGLYSAAQCLMAGECECALVGAANIFPPRNWGYMHQPGLNFSSDGHCRAFDASADGMIGGEGVAVIVLKRAVDALEAGDPVYALLRGIRMNNDGADKVGFYAPSVRGQAEVIQNVLSATGVDPQTVGYVEAHGTGTKLGDPIEFNALADVYQRYTTKKQFCGLGSVKSNIGHLDTAAGLAGCIKVLLSLHHKEIPPSINYAKPNPDIHLEDSPFYVVEHLKNWEKEDSPRRAALSSFGLGGTNVHALFEEWDSSPLHPDDPSAPPGNSAASLVPLSAASEERLRAYAERLLQFLKSASPDTVRLEDLTYTLQVGREAMAHRAVWIVRDTADLAEKVEAFLEGKTKGEGCLEGDAGDTVRLFEQDPDFQSLLDTWIEKGNGTKIADLWVKGLSLDWNRLYPTRRPRRIHLPVYPFEETVYPLPGSEIRDVPPARAENPVASETPSGAEDLSDLTYIPIWEPRPAAPYVPARAPETVLVVTLGSPNSLAAAIVERCRQSHPLLTVIQIREADQTAECEKNHWQVDCGDPGGFEACLKQYPAVDSLFFLCGTPGEARTEPSFIDGTGASAPEIQLLRLVKYLKRHNPPNHILDCYLLTQDIHRMGDGATNYYGGGVSGLAYALAQGSHHFSVRNIDITAEDPQSPEEQAWLAEAVLNEKPSPRGDLIKFQTRTRCEQRLCTLGEQDFPSPSSFRQEGVYVIVGGSGSVGQIITRGLIQTYRARVVWIGRRPVSDPSVADALKRCRVGDVSPDYVQADGTDFTQLQSAVETVHQKWGSIHGAVFSAVVVKYDNSVDRTTEAEFREILEVKTAGTVHFYNAFKDHPLDFMCFFSSAQAFAFSGAASLSAYASGITFSDAFVRHIVPSSPFPVGVIHWGFWAAPKEHVLKETFQFANIGFLQDREGFDCFERFTGWLGRGACDRALCMRVAPAVRPLMPLNPRETLVIAPAGTKPVLPSLLRSLPVPTGNLNSLLAAINPDMFDQWMAKLLFHQLRQMGIFRQTGERASRESLRQRAGILPKYGRFFSEAFEILETHGFIQCCEERGDVLVETKRIGDESVWDAWLNAKAAIFDPSPLKKQMQLTEACLAALPKILRGETLATAVLFPDGSLDRVEEIYKSNAFVDYFNSVVADITEAYVKHRLSIDTQAKVRIIEIGAGTGGTSAAVFERLRPWAHAVEYTYTDLSPTLLSLARNRFGSETLCRDYRVWDISRPPAPQGIAQGAYDLAIAANVLHATPDIRRSIRHAKAALKTNGLLLLNEVIVKTSIGTLSFGLTDGWWLYEDEPLRIPGSPLLTRDTWGKVLMEEGFRQIRYPTHAALLAGQQIIAAESDGLIRQAIIDSPEKGKDGMKKDAEPKRRPLAPPFGAAQGNREDFVRSVVVEHLSESIKRSADRIENHVAFSDYGVDSIVSVHFVNRLGESLGIELNPSLLFSFSTVDRLTEYIMDTFGERLNPPPPTPEPAPAPDPQILKDQFLAGRISTDALLEAIKP